MLVLSKEERRYMYIYEKNGMKKEGGKRKKDGGERDIYIKFVIFLFFC